MYYSAPYLREKTRIKPTGGKETYFQGILRYKDGNGVWRQITKVFHTSKKKEAKKLLNDWYEEMEHTASINPNIPAVFQKKMSDKSVREAVLDYLNFQRKTGHLESSSYSNQYQYAIRHVFPYLGDLAFKDVTWQVIQDWETKLRDDLSENSVGICHSLLRKTYKAAFMKQQIPSNPFDYVQPPKKKKTPINYLDKQGKDKLIATVNMKWSKGDAYRTAIYLAYFSGLRASEICGLKWSNVKIAARVFRIENAIGRKYESGKDGGTYVKSTKNDSSTREIPMNNKIAEVLEQRRKIMKEEYEKKDGEIQFNNLYVVGDIDGNYLDVRLLGSNFARFAKNNDIRGVLGKHITMHGLRHTFATDAVKNGMDIKSLASILGHTKADMTLNTYASDDAEAKRLAMARMEELYEKEENEDW